MNKGKLAFNYNKLYVRSNLILKVSRKVSGAQKAMYACCKHGPRHKDVMPNCTYAHRLDEIRLPEKYNWKMWQDLSAQPKGRPGIDIFCGQEYSPNQYERVLACIANEKI